MKETSNGPFDAGQRAQSVTSSVYPSNKKDKQNSRWKKEGNKKKGGKKERVEGEKSQRGIKGQCAMRLLRQTSFGSKQATP